MIGARPPAVLAGLAALVLLGCGSYHPRPSKANVAESNAIIQRLSDLPGVVRADGGYNFDLEDPGSAQISIAVRAGANLEAVADDAVAAVWRSRLDPIRSMTVLVGRRDKPTINVDRHVDFVDEKADLTRRYGPRPVG